MHDVQTDSIIREYRHFVGNKDFPCIAAKAALSDDHIRIMVADHLACPKDDRDILQFLYDFTCEYRASEKLYHSAVIIFKEPEQCDENIFDAMLWKRLQAISDLDALHHRWDPHVSKDVTSPDFSFSIMEEAFYVIALHPGSGRNSRQFKYPALVFNPHDQFEKLRASNKYSAMSRAVRKRDMKFSGSVNPMLAEFGESPEVFQYSGIQYDKNWRCPFIAKHEGDEHYSAT